MAFILSFQLKGEENYNTQSVFLLGVVSYTNQMMARYLKALTYTV